MRQNPSVSISLYNASFLSRPHTSSGATIAMPSSLSTGASFAAVLRPPLLARSALAPVFALTLARTGRSEKLAHTSEPTALFLSTSICRRATSVIGCCSLQEADRLMTG